VRIFTVFYGIFKTHFRLAWCGYMKKNYPLIPFIQLSLLVIINAKDVLAYPNADPVKKYPSKTHYLRPANTQANANSKLREAMALYYNAQYRLALTLLQAVAVNDTSTQVLFWLGRSAYETGQTSLAIETYQQILAREPKLSRVRLELAAAYMQAGNKTAADAELSKILDENPDTGLKQKIEQTRQGLAQPIEQGKRFSAAIRASIGPEYDSNINVSPRAEVIPLPNSQQITTQKLDGWLMKFNVNAESLYDFGNPNGFVWHNRLQFLHNEYPDPTNSNFNYTQTDAYTGLDYYNAKFKVKAPVGFIDRRFSNQPLSRSYYFVPNLEINVLDKLDFALSYRFENEDFIGTQYDALGGISHTGTFGPRFRFETLDAQHSLALFGAYSRRNANSAAWSFNEWSMGPSYFARFKTGTELYLDFKYLNRDYDAPATLFVSQGNRLDNRYAVTFSLSQTFKKYYYVSLNYNYTDNSSNAQLFTYDKNMVGLNFGTNLNF
jgi:tetratricopeptide (TPR) repeat protein